MRDWPFEELDDLLRLSDEVLRVGKMEYSVLEGRLKQGFDMFQSWVITKTLSVSRRFLSNLMTHIMVFKDDQNLLCCRNYMVPFRRQVQQANHLEGELSTYMSFGSVASYILLCLPQAKAFLGKKHHWPRNTFGLYLSTGGVLFHGSCLLRKFGI